MPTYPPIKLTPTYHTSPYPAISPLRPELSQAGKTILITGGSAGIGYSIAEAFVLARASRVIILGRHPDTVNSAVTALTALSQSKGSGKTKVVGLECDIGSTTAAAALWGRLAGEGVAVDVLVLNAAAIPPVKTLFDMGTEHVWAHEYDLNVRAQLDMAERFYKQQAASGPKYLVHVSTMAIHDWFVNALRAYGLTKSAGAAALQTVALDVPPEKMQIINYHPGAIFTPAAKNAGFTKDTLPWDDADLPGHFAVWAATPEAAFLHGRFVWASWDVDELKNGDIRKKIDEDPYYLKVGVKGL
ncbi:NAD(P)-binding protein [Jackrogersella minutella]|nr:NAD(P)-binding protein [Jackrogersella minutella]